MRTRKGVETCPNAHSFPRNPHKRCKCQVAFCTGRCRDVALSCDGQCRHAQVARLHSRVKDAHAGDQITVNQVPTLRRVRRKRAAQQGTARPAAAIRMIGAGDGPLGDPHSNWANPALRNIRRTIRTKVTCCTPPSRNNTASRADGSTRVPSSSRLPLPTPCHASRARSHAPSR